MRCQICDNKTENSCYNVITRKMDCICGKCSGVIAETVTEDQITYEDNKSVEQMSVDEQQVFFDALLDAQGYGVEQ